MPGSYYFDTSALVKRYAAEIGSSWVATLLDARPNAFVSTFTFVEVIAGLSRRAPVISSDVFDRFEAEYQRGFSRVAVSSTVIEQSAHLACNRRLRAGDALQLASALIVVQRIPDLVFVCADEGLNDAARAEGFETENPNEHP
jgi:predicted nucleic acid-binding protein